MEINLLPKFLDEAVTPVAQTVGNTLSSIWTIAFGSIDIYSEKTTYKRKVAFNKFIEELEHKVSSVPEENIVEPPLHLIGPTIDAAKYYFESDVLRSMFSNLIAASIDVNSVSKAHPSFVEIIKQLSPLDAKNMEVFKSRSINPIVNYIFILKDGKGEVNYLTNVFMESQGVFDIDLNAASLSNLTRLGLVNIDFDRELTDESRYDQYLNYPSYNHLKEIIINDKADPEDYLYQFEDIRLQKGLVGTTPFGKNFVDICI
ncbi:DUF4393 domain-containing protein [Peribacillus simplex]|uniref:DUF4393 domain-containing protein n=1 Tax=Peribacillus simplex TaxID=1478 RepID=UPI00366C33FE